MKSSLAPFALSLLLGGCVWNPADQSMQSRFLSVPMSGFGQTDGSTIRVYAFNHETGVDDEVAVTNTGSTPMFGEPHLYSWNAGWRVFEQKYWYPPAAGCSSGMLRLRVTEDGAQLPTFTAGQRDCVLDEVSTGDHPVGAAQQCGYQMQIVINSPSDC